MKVNRYALALTTLCAFMLASSGARADSMPMAITGYFDSARGAEWVFYEDAWGDIFGMEHTSSGWSGTTIETYGGKYSFSPGASLVGGFDGSNDHLFFETLNTNGSHLIELYGVAPNFSTNDLTVSSHATVHPTGIIDTYQSCPLGYSCTNVVGVKTAPTIGQYFDSSENAHLFFGASDGHMHETYHNGPWYDRAIETTDSEDPDQIATSAGQGLSALWDGAIGHVYFVGFNGQLHQFYNNGNWWDAPLTTPPPTPYSFLTSCTTGYDYQWLFGNTTNDSLQYFVNEGYWQNGQIPSEPYLVETSPMITYSAGGQLEIFYVGTDDNIYDAWNFVNVTSVTGAPKAASTNTALSPITGFWDGSYRHVFYIANDDQVHELYSQGATGTWSTGNEGGLTAFDPPAW